MQYGARLMAMVVYLLPYQFIPEDRLVALMADLFGVKLAAGTVARFSTRCAQRFQGCVAGVCEAVKTAAVKPCGRNRLSHRQTAPLATRRRPRVAEFLSLFPQARAFIGRLAWHLRA